MFLKTYELHEIAIWTEGHTGKKRLGFQLDMQVYAED